LLTSWLDFVLCFEDFNITDDLADEIIGIHYIIGGERGMGIGIVWGRISDFFLNNQPDALIIQIYSVTKLYMFRASSLPIIRISVLYIQHWFHAGF